MDFEENSGSDKSRDNSGSKPFVTSISAHLNLFYGFHSDIIKLFEITD
jgi:hypothetical protein